MEDWLMQKKLNEA